MRQEGCGGVKPQALLCICSLAAQGLLLAKLCVTTQCSSGALTLMTLCRYPSVLSIGVSASKVPLRANLSFSTACSWCARSSASCCNCSFSSRMAADTSCNSSFCLQPNRHPEYHQPRLWRCRRLKCNSVHPQQTTATRAAVLLRTASDPAATA